MLIFGHTIVTFVQIVSTLFTLVVNVDFHSLISTFITHEMMMNYFDCFGSQKLLDIAKLILFP